MTIVFIVIKLIIVELLIILIVKIVIAFNLLGLLLLAYGRSIVIWEFNCDLGSSSFRLRRCSHNMSTLLEIVIVILMIVFFIFIFILFGLA